MTKTDSTNRLKMKKMTERAGTIMKKRKTLSKRPSACKRKSKENEQWRTI